MKRIVRIGISLFLFFVSITATIYYDVSDVQAVTDVPRIVLDSYEIIDGSFAVGQKTNIKLHLKNTSAGASAENVLLTYNGESNYVYSELGDSNQIYLGSIAPDTVVEVDLTIIVSANTDTDSIPISFTADYVNSATDQRDTNQFMIFAPVNNLNMIYNVSVASSARVGTRAFISASVLNNGYYTAKEVKMNITGNIETDEESKDLVAQKSGNSVTFDIGDIDAHSSEYIDSAVVFSESGMQTITISFIFKDKDDGEQFQVAGEYNVNVVENSDDDNKDNKSGKVSPAWVVCIIIGIAGLATAIFLFIRKNKNGKISTGFIENYIHKIRRRF